MCDSTIKVTEIFRSMLLGLFNHDVMRTLLDLNLPIESKNDNGQIAEMYAGDFADLLEGAGLTFSVKEGNDTVKEFKSNTVETVSYPEQLVLLARYVLTPFMCCFEF